MLTREVVFLLLLGVVVPLADVALDLRTGAELVLEGHPDWGLAVIAFALVPCAIRLVVAAAMPVLPRACWPSWMEGSESPRLVVLMRGILQSLFLLPGVPLVKFCWHYRHVMLDSSHPDFATRVLRTCNWLAYLEAGIEAGPQMFLQMGIIIRLGFCSILQLVSLLVSACTFSFAVSKAHCFRNKEFDNLLGSEVHRVPPGRVLRVMVPVLPFVVVAQLSWVVVATNGWLSSWWWCVVLAPATSLGHFERFRHSPLFLTLGDQLLFYCRLRVLFKAVLLVLTSLFFLWFRVFFADSESWRPEDYPPVFYCFLNFTSSHDDRFRVFNTGNESLIALCTSAPCPARVRACSEEEAALDMYRHWVAPILTGLLLTLPLWAWAAHRCLKREVRNLREEQGVAPHSAETTTAASRRQQNMAGEATCCKMFCLPEELLYGGHGQEGANSD